MSNAIVHCVVFLNHVRTKCTTCYKALNADVPAVRNTRARFGEEIRDNGTNRSVIGFN
ncbi:hypothetical protein WN48_01436 [Eufriesea mexicana]|nr:hypothetical protein WN48_01436 [Eufriesea mexicana]